MTTLYARPNLTALTDPGGWSYTSGGPAAGISPLNQDLIFDANSGVPRIITGFLEVQSLRMNGSAMMSFVDEIRIAGSSVLKGLFNQVYIHKNGVANTAVRELDVTDATFVNLIVSNCTCVIYKGVLRVSENLGVSGRDYNNASLTITSPEKLAIVAALYLTRETATDSNASLIIDNGLVEVTGVSGSFSHAVYINGSLSLGLNGTLKLTNKTDAVKSLNFTSARGAGFTHNFVNDTGSGSVGGVSWSGASQLFSTYDAGPGCKNVFLGGNTYTANNWIIDGAGAETQMLSSTTTRATLALANNASIIASSTRFRYITLNNGRVINGVDGGGNTGITFTKIFSRFFPFF